MNDKKVGKAFSFIFGGILLLIILLLLGVMFFAEDIREYLRDHFRDDEPISAIYKYDNYNV
ncbi:hypothetical protein [Bacillus tuaregi]|uniref:hypothetical protein n=1 Tax=Bacillus tuaregi TaxID=1816695 RepID=UPI0008F861F3|nr:hypothetical protein [Bacillus tuaregi]